MEYDEQEDEEIEENEEEDETEEGEEEKDEEKEKCVKEDDTPWNQVYYKCKDAVENSSRFSLRVMEAMRLLQSYENVLPISSVKDIVDYITKNYNNDGDLYAQVRTALKQLCTYGFVVEVLNDEYQLIGPFGSSAMLDVSNCDVDRSDSEIYFSTPKHTKLRRKFSEKCKKISRCDCGKLQDEPKLETKRKGSIFSDKNISLSRMDDLNNTIFATPKYRVLRPRVRDNVKIHSTTENIAKGERSAYANRGNHGNKSPEHTPKRIRKTKNNDVTEASQSIKQYEKTNLTPTDRVNENPRDSIFQEIKNLFPTRSQTREKELRKWIQRCRRECERQKKNN